MNEFELIQHYFQSPQPASAALPLGIGDDAAIVDIPTDMQLVVATDTLVAGVHFPQASDPAKIASRCLRVNISDMAAMAAQPRWYCLALTIPSADQQWLSTFSASLHHVAAEFNMQLIGGDTTAGPLTITIQCLGLAPKNRAIKRSGAQVDDDIWLTGHLGDAALALKAELIQSAPLVRELNTQQQDLIQRYWQPPNLVNFAMDARQLMHACIDISDGLAADLGHICHASKTGARVQLDQIPLSNSALWQATQLNLNQQQLVELAITSGDDYQLCLTAPPERQQQLQQCAMAHNLELHKIGTIDNSKKLTYYQQEQPIDGLAQQGYQHF